MLRPYRAAAGVLLAGALSLGAAACTTAPAATPTPTPTKSATDVLSEAVGKGQAQSYTYEQTYGTMMTSNGSRDAGGQNFKSNMTLSAPGTGLVIKGDVISVGSDVYLRLDMGALSGAIPGLAGLGAKWMRLDKTKLTSSGFGSSLAAGSTVDAATFTKGVVSAEQVSATEIKGTMDITKSAPSGVPGDELAKIGPEAKAVPFTVTLDGEGRIAKFVLNMPKMGESPPSDLTTVFSNYGSAVTITAPSAAEVVDAPAMIYQLLA